MVPTQRYATWKVAAGWEIKAQNPGRIEGRFEAHLLLEDGKRIDLDNATKCALDILQDYGVIDNDKHCRKITLEWSGKVKGVWVSLRAL